MHFYIPRQPSAGHQEGNTNIRPGFSFETYNISTKELRRLHLLNVRKGYMVYNIDPQDPEDLKSIEHPTETFNIEAMKEWMVKKD